VTPDAVVIGDTGTVDASPPDAAGPLRFHCGEADPLCPALTVAGDAPSTDPFHGYGDPALERDPGGALWLSYSWLDHEVLPGTVDPLRAVRTHLAKSTDDGATFTYVRAVNVAAPAPGNVALVIHEVSSIARRSDGSWADTWLTYAMNSAARGQFHYQRTLAAAPEALGDTTEAWLRGTVTTVTTTVDASKIGGPETCAGLTEPALFSRGGVDYLITNCIVDGTPATQRLIVLRETGATLELVGDLLTAADAIALDATRIEQIDLAVAKDGALLALVTPINDAAQPIHRGCVVLEVEDLATAKIARDTSGALVQRAVITSAGTSIGPGLCTYDATSATGIVLVQTYDTAGGGVVFSMHATGVHP